MFRLLVTYFITVAMLFTFLGTPAAFANEMHKSDVSEEPGGESIIFDVVLVRPLGIATIGIGTAFFIASLPFGITSGSTRKAAKALVATPFNFTFARPLGDFNGSDPKPYPAGQDTGAGRDPK